MPFDASGVYTPASGATTAAAGDIIHSATWNNIHTDISNALTEIKQDRAVEIDSRATAIATSFVSSVNVVETQGYTTPGDGGGASYKRVSVQPTHGGKFQSVDGTWWEIVTNVEGVSVKAFGATGNGTTDDTAAIQAAIDYSDGGWVFIPVGTYSVSQVSRLTSTTDVFRNGMKIRGQGRGSHLVARTSNKAVLLWDVGYVPNGTITPALKFTRGSEVHSILITQAGGLTTVDGIKLTAAWNVLFRDVWIEGMSGHAIHVPFRSDIYAAISDYWQCFCLDFQQCRFSECTDWGVYFNGGQSPGLWRMQYCTIANNSGGGLYNTTGHFIFTDNLIVTNGSYLGNGGHLNDSTIEGAGLVATIERNEYDTNFEYHLKLVRARNWRVSQNRFLSQTFNSNTGFVFTSGSAFMRPDLQIVLGDGTTHEVWNSLFEANYHRTITGAGPTTAAVYAYIMFPGSTGVQRNRFVNNELGFRDGVNLNSSGMDRYNGINVDGDANSIVDGNLVGLSASASAVTAITGSATTITFGTEQYDTHTAFVSPTFTTPHRARYRIASTIMIAGLASGNVVTLGIYVNGSATRTSLYTAGGLANESFNTTADLVLAESDLITIRASQTNGANKNTDASTGTRLSITQIN